MHNINIVYFLQPLIVILAASGLVVYWHYRRSLRGIDFLYSLIAYAGAIALKYAVQIPTASSIVAFLALKV